MISSKLAASGFAPAFGALVGLALSGAAAFGSAAPDPDRTSIIRSLESALHQGADTERMVVLLDGLRPDLVREWLVQEIGHTDSCEAPAWMVALRAALAKTQPEGTVLLLADVLARADAGLYDCILLQADRELPLGDAERYELLAATLGASGILDAPDGLVADEALVRRVLDQLLSPGALTPFGPAAPFLNPLEPERPISES